MKAPSNELKAMADAPKSDLEAHCIDWGNLLKKVKIGYFISASTETLAKSLGFNKYSGGKKGLVFELFFHPTAEEYLAKQDRGGPVWVATFREDGTAQVSIVKHVGESHQFQGSWEEVTRKLFEMEKEMLSQIPEVPADLKQL